VQYVSGIEALVQAVAN